MADPDRSPPALRASGLHIDGEGRFVHDGEVVTHPGLRAALARWLARADDGRHLFRLDDGRAVTVTVSGAPLVARAARTAGERAWLALSDGRELALERGGLQLSDDGHVTCEVEAMGGPAAGRLRARLSTSALATLADAGWLEGLEPG